MSKGYAFFDRFVFRTPLYPYNGKVSTRNVDASAFREGVFLASAELHKERHKHEESGKYDAKMEQSLYKYLTRATTRCTPFGLFAGCSVGHFSADDKGVTIGGINTYRRAVRLDMSYLSALVENLEARSEIREKVLFFPNDTIYPLGGKLRYVEYGCVNKQRVHRISSVEPDEYLTGVLEFAAQGKSVREMVDYLAGDEIEEGDAREYVDELIASQLFKSELGLRVTGDDSLEVLISQLQKIDRDTEIVRQLLRIKGLLDEITATPLGEAQDKYDAIISTVQEIGVDFEPKYLFQCDMYKPVIAGGVPQDIKNDLSSLLVFLSKITPQNTGDANLREFAKTFYEYYEDREMPLSQLMDSELGIGFAANGSADEPNDMLKGLGGRFELRNQAQQLPPTSILQPVLFKKYIEYVRTGGNCCA